MFYTKYHAYEKQWLFVTVIWGRKDREGEIEARVRTSKEGTTRVQGRTRKTDEEERSQSCLWYQR